MNEDFTDLLTALLEAEARFLVVGAHAMAIHGIPRATGDLDLWIQADQENASRVWRALQRFGAPLESLGVRRPDLHSAGIVIQIGVPPRRIDLMTQASGLTFDEAWKNKVLHPIGALSVPFLGRTELIRNKRATGRPKDLADLAALEEPPIEP
ncbi:MAG TPA: hypothetical protein VFV75_06100 [Candidatus Polarisedimenticolaceae bacterium]|nr:hypothetical protein [Candidatus Polarisedimenticolaceae bacterium]